MRKRTILIFSIMLIFLLGAAGAYAAIGMHYRTHFFANVTINGIDVSEMTAAEAEALIAAQAEDFRVTLRTKDGGEETIEGGDFDYRFVSGGEVQAFLEAQNFLAWLPACLGAGSEYAMEASVTYDEEKLLAAASALACMQEEQTTAPQDAYVTRQEDGTYVIVPETEGNRLDSAKVDSALKEAVATGGGTIDLTEAGCYLQPSVTADDASLKAGAAVRNRYGSITVTYQLGGDVTEVLDKDTVNSWFSLDDDLQPVFDREAVAAWVNALADKYDTIGSFLPFVTSNGETVYPESRTYGWQMDREAETEALYELLMAGNSAERSPVWQEGAWTRGENDIGNTYVEIDYTNQRMWYYKDGVLLVETAIVTGNVNAGMASPEGVFCLVGKEEDATLVGEDYKTPVDYWMPFYGGVGIHDADSWRSTYGGDIYLWSGSHGCINTPTAQAAIIYENIEIGTPIVCYSSGTNYGYGQTSGGSSGTASGDAADIVIVDGTGDGTNTTDGAADSTGAADGTGGDAGASDGTAGDTSQGIDIIDEDWADESTYYGNGTADFPITTEDSWSGSADELVIW